MVAASNAVDGYYVNCTPAGSTSHMQCRHEDEFISSVWELYAHALFYQPERTFPTMLEIPARTSGKLLPSG